MAYGWANGTSEHIDRERQSGTDTSRTTSRQAWKRIASQA